MQSLNVGEINDLKISGHKVVATIGLNSNFQVLKGSIVQVDIDNIFGKKSMVLTPIANTEILTDGDTIYGISGNKIINIKQMIKIGDVDSLLKVITLISGTLILTI